MQRRHSYHFCSALVASALTVLANGSTLAQPSGSVQDAMSALEKRIEKLETPQKDFWDKLSALSTLLSGIVVSAIGFYATNVYNRRQKAAEEERKNQEVRVAQVQTIERFIPHLAKEDTKAAALVAISAMGNEVLAVKLAEAFPGTGSTTALARIAGGKSAAAASDANRILDDIFSYLRARVVTVHDGAERRATGFVASAEGHVVTTAHAVATLSEAPQVGLPSGVLAEAKLVHIDIDLDLALLRVELREPIPSLELTPAAPEMGASVLALLISPEGVMKASVGNISLMQADFAHEGKWKVIGVRLASEPGASGAPVLDEKGRLIGLIQARNTAGDRLLIPFDRVLRFLDRDDGPPKTALNLMGVIAPAD